MGDGNIFKWFVPIRRKVLVNRNLTTFDAIGGQVLSFSCAPSCAFGLTFVENYICLFIKSWQNYNQS